MCKFNKNFFKTMQLLNHFIYQKNILQQTEYIFTLSVII